MNDLGYAKNPLAWVQAYCPLIRRTAKMTECAYLIGDGPILHHGNVFNPKADDRVEVFDSFEDIFSAGWKVD